MTETSLPETTHVSQSDKIVDPTIDKDPSHWTVQRDLIPDVHLVIFQNKHIGYVSYNPPKGFTAEELVEFKGAKESRFDLEKARAVIAQRDERGTLDLTGDARWSGPVDKTKQAADSK
ncbi:hypothetical protein E4T56_gene16081 [Termitomyces sp. T112]|nr:hypothetical protein C0989_008154 [Termitomyces sp. Mn162]KAG5724387.1 hypothetical protein E4T56_gene16081 [Termitomyces sp. T112]KAH0591597.1 hypothetical protein H2248_001648 [Termitomyces sp. 'cryptogamus']KNZ72965.1 hypothetical protein J132_01478 [Termitomyces sp. J132]